MKIENKIRCHFAKINKKIFYWNFFKMMTHHHFIKKLFDMLIKYTKL